MERRLGKKKQKEREKKQGKREGMGLGRPFDESLVMSYNKTQQDYKIINAEFIQFIGQQNFAKTKSKHLPTDPIKQALP